MELNPAGVSWILRLPGVLLVSRMHSSARTFCFHLLSPYSLYLLYSTLLHSTLLYSTLLYTYSTLLYTYSTLYLLYSTLLYSTLLYSTLYLLYSTLLYTYSSLYLLYSTQPTRVRLLSARPFLQRVPCAHPLPALCPIRSNACIAGCRLDWRRRCMPWACYSLHPQ